MTRTLVMALMLSSALPAVAAAADRIAGGPGTKAVLSLTGTSGTGGDDALNYQQDQDWYRLDVTPGANYVVLEEGQYLPDPLVDLTLWDAHAHKVYFQRAGNAQTFGGYLNYTTVKFNASQSTVFVGLSANKQASSGAYLVTLHHSCAHNTSTICTIKPGQTATAFRATSRDSLWYRTRLVKGVTYTTDDIISVRNAQGKVLEITSCQPECTFKAPYSGAYFLEVFGTNDPHDVGFADVSFTLTAGAKAARVAAGKP